MDHAAIRDYYDSRYRGEGADPFPPDPARYREWLAPLPRPGRLGSLALDYGCGPGYVCSYLADLGYETVGIDISPTALEAARAREPRSRFLEATADGSLPFPDGSFDVVTCLGVLEHIPEPVRVVGELARVARSEAVGVWVVPNRRSPYFWLGHGTGQIEEVPRSLGGWRDLLRAGGWTVEAVRRDPGPLDRPIASWKQLAQGLLNLLPLSLTYQFVIAARPTRRSS